MGEKTGVFLSAWCLEWGLFCFALLSLSLVFFSFQPLLCLSGLGGKGVQLLVLGKVLDLLFFPSFFSFVLGISVGRGGEFFYCGF